MKKEPTKVRKLVLIVQIWESNSPTSLHIKGREGHRAVLMYKRKMVRK